ncbi:threo-3-hydroxy-L-aspartate ammonia-lyase [Longimicrobium terrae]|uniref:Threonine dehydratase n=1 Tax=Longimicrobium terrae TaxID=1639882 RepID=A0A841H0S4_9BACT|nr:threo-3-hydroxy-L-aspartate ammonia-lyase [Longimicrobium terrae]MBB4637195.1 threonine dehydratase [Longimicrobium terrae]MBB6071544.1 threonine dehydratase [Longimicrobium terrae]NNC30037.1 threo-3-hydroxy-L-aspartate ammonia-lyase [Longimicrobium terrae]
MSENPILPTAADVHAAAERLRGNAHRTPVMTSRTLNERFGAEFFFKCENLQRGGSFKFRGAFNSVSALTASQRALGVLTYSSGNHAQAVALTGRILGVRTAIVMPDDAPQSKIEGTRGYGGEVILYDKHKETREEIAITLQAERGMTLLPPYDHAGVIAGQGTAALELLHDVAGLTVMMTPCGGGGLLSGTALAAKDAVPGIRVVGVEPELADDATRSFRTGTLQTVRNPPTIADGLRTPALGQLTFPLIRQNVSEMRTVSEEAIVEAMRFLWTRMKIVVEPSGAVPLAAVMSDPDAFRGERVGMVITGGNVDLANAFALLA